MTGAKRLIDVVLATVLLVLTAPIQAATAVLVAVDLGRPTLFHQLRMGRGGQPFRVSKFRSMRHQPEVGAPLSDEERVTPLGRAIRRFRLDELPQTLLILTGKMSLVGPRPLYPSGHASENDPLFQRRHKVRPGMTGWAQVNGNTLLSEREKLALDVDYVSRVSLIFDLRILWLTVLTVLRGERRNEANIERALIHADRLDRHG
jgi:lipopolysaccharide/colanic/teichoic acid biosynthesis glycosyltransferase